MTDNEMLEVIEKVLGAYEECLKADIHQLGRPWSKAILEALRPYLKSEQAHERLEVFIGHELNGKFSVNIASSCDFTEQEAIDFIKTYGLKIKE